MQSGTDLTAKNGAQSSSLGSIVSATSLSEEEEMEEDVGRVGGWIASFDKLLEDPLGVACLQVCELPFTPTSHSHVVNCHNFNVCACLLLSPHSC